MFSGEVYTASVLYTWITELDLLLSSVCTVGLYLPAAAGCC